MEARGNWVRLLQSGGIGWGAGRFRAGCRSALGLIIVALLALLAGGCGDRVVLSPSTRVMIVPGAAREVVKGDSGVLEVWVARPGGRQRDEVRGYVLQFTGKSTRAEQVAQVGAAIWRDWPVEVWTVNYPGYGGSTGPATTRGIPPAALAVYDELARVAGSRPIFVQGTSLGTTVAIYVAAQREVAGVVLKNPLPLKQLVLEYYGWWNLWIAAGITANNLPPELDSLENGQKVHAPAVFVMADSDMVAPPPFQRQVLRAYAGQKRAIILQQAGHTTPVRGKAAEELREGVRWLWEGRAQAVKLQVSSDGRTRAGRLYSEGTPRGTRARDTGQ